MSIKSLLITICLPAVAVPHCEHSALCPPISSPPNQLPCDWHGATTQVCESKTQKTAHSEGHICDHCVL